MDSSAAKLRHAPPRFQPGTSLRKPLLPKRGEEPRKFLSVAFHLRFFDSQPALPVDPAPFQQDLTCNALSTLTVEA